MKFFFNTEVKIASSNVGTTRLQTLYLTRAILLMNNQPMVSIVMVMDVFLYNCSYQEGEEGGSSAKQ